jgi:hypothetical protein
MQTKHPIVILTTITLLTTLLVPMFIIPMIQAQPVDPPEWTTTSYGVLDTDEYLLYPYTDTSLNVGFSKFGELIDCHTGVGLEYGARDPFGNELVSKERWLNGWFIDISYKHRWLAQKDRKLWAMAMHADGLALGGDWITGAEDPRDAPHGGRKTSTYAETEDLMVLYDGPRRFVAVSTTHIFDVEGEGDEGEGAMWPIVDVIITLIFNKVKKEVIVLKDVKLTIDPKDLLGKVDIEFSNRAEWDLGPAPTLASYAHFYHQYGDTCYGGEWLMADSILRKQVDKYTYVESKDAPWTETLKCPTLECGFPVAEASEKVYINNMLLERGIDKDYTINYNSGEITFLDSYEADEDNPLKLVVEYKNVVKWLKNPVTGEETAESHHYDVAQIISSDRQVVGFAAFWPTTSDYTVDGWDDWYKPLRNVPFVFSDDVDMSNEPDIPFVIGEWDFLLSHAADEMQFRGVTVYGVTDYHDALDTDMPAPVNRLDREVQYQLDEVFMPFDLNDAVHKSTKRWVEWKPYGMTSITLKNTPVLVVPDEEWDQYCTFSDRVIRLDRNELLHRRSNDPKAGSWKDYNIVLNPDGTATLTGLPMAECKILYSTKEVAGGIGGLIQLGLCLDGSGSISPADWTVIKNGVAAAITDSLPHDGSVELTVVQFGFDTPLDSQIEVAPTVVNYDATANAIAAAILAMAQGGDNTPMAHGLNLTWSAMKNSPRFVSSEMQIINVATDGLPNILLPESPTGIAPDDVTWVRDMAYLEGLDEIDAEAIGMGPDVPWMQGGLVLPQPGTVAPPYDPGWVEAVPDAEAFAEAMATKFEIIIPWIPGRYEWMIVGKDAATVDSIGAAYMTEAFDSIKDIPVCMTGLDIRDTEYGANVPFVMAGSSTGTRTDYYYDYPMDNRSALRDDWCRTYPVASSNMLFSGGPRANLGTEYFNDFTNAFYAMGEYVVNDTGHKDNILALTCWNKNVYENEFGTGYAVISTYKDINGTVGLLIWGIDGQDTYYATQWFWNIPMGTMAPDGTIVYSGIEYLQHENECVTDIILEITYPPWDPIHPYVSVVECLGTISEKPQHDP